MSEQRDSTEFDATFEATQRRQVLAGLELDPAGRLRWLEERMTELFRLQGLARPSSTRPR